MSWQLIQVFGGRGLKTGEFGVKIITNNIKTPSFMSGKTANWYLDDSLMIAKIQLEKDGIKTLHASLSVPRIIKEKFKEEQTVVYMAEDAIYFTPYKKGQEHLSKFLKAQKVI